VKSDPPIFEIPQVVRVEENIILAACESARGALNLAQLILKNIKPGNVRFSLHAGPVSIDQFAKGLPVTGATATEISIITKNALPGLIYCSEQVAAILVLDRQDLLFHPVGKIEVPEDQKGIDVFTIDLMP
jgi:hypothetical protein